MAYDNLHAQLHPTHCSPWTIAHLAPLSLGFSRQDYWSGLPCPPPGDLPCPRGRTCISWVSGFFTDWATWEDQWQLTGLWKHLHIPWTTIEITGLPLFKSLSFQTVKIESLCYLNWFLLLKTDFQSSRRYTHHNYTKSPTFYSCWFYDSQLHSDSW